MFRTTEILPGINSPRDLKKLSLEELTILADEIRRLIVSTVSQNGGHLSSNLGVVELSIALHRVFNSPEDKIIWDVGHQCYAHKLLTGRFGFFSTLRKAGGIAGFPKNEESPHDAFNTGHASTSISAALGILAAERLQNGKGHAVAVIGDGALTGGLAYEAFSHAGQLGLPLIVILNDNKMSISRNVGGLSKYLSRLSMKKYYQTFRRNFDAMARRIPLFGEMFFSLVLRLKRAVKAVFYTDNFFVDLGFEYVGPIRGHQIKTLIEVFSDARKLGRPVVIHVITQKGKGYGFAEDDPGSYHGVGAFSVDNGIGENKDNSTRPTFTGAFAGALLAAGARASRVTAVTAAMEKGVGLTAFRRAFPGRFFDVGIAEEHAVTFAAGLAIRGIKPVVAIYSTFIQRSVDQIIHDAALQKLPVVFALDRAGFVGEDGETHQGVYDIAIFRPVPNTAILAPASESELKLMLDWALEQNSGPVIIRYPKARCPQELHEFSQPVEKGRGVWLKRGNESRICLAFTGSLYKEAKGAAAILAQWGIEADLYNLRFLKPVDESYLCQIMNVYSLVVFIEEGVRDGGFAEFASSLARKNNCAARVETMAIEGDYAAKNRALGSREELIAMNGLDEKRIAIQVKARYSAQAIIAEKSKKV
jgi:1-deoxy-D-xylulose-5-phosphate synthase